MAGFSFDPLIGQAHFGMARPETGSDLFVSRSFPIGETFRVLKEKETAKFGEYRTRRLALEAWDRLT